MNQAVRRRRLLSFGLRELLIFMLVVALLSIWSGRRIEQGRQQQAILTEIEAAGWHVSFDNDDYEWGQLHWWNFLFGLNPLHHVVGVEYDHYSEDEDIDYREEKIDLGALVELKNLKQLCVSHTQVSDLSPLAQLTNLEGLNVSYTQVSDQQVQQLQDALPNCRIYR